MVMTRHKKKKIGDKEGRKEGREIRKDGRRSKEKMEDGFSRIGKEENKKMVKTKCKKEKKNRR